MSQSHPLKAWSQHTFTVHSRGRGLVDITENLRHALAASAVQGGIANVFVQHTSCSLIVGENADPVTLICPLRSSKAVTQRSFGMTLAKASTSSIFCPGARVIASITSTRLRSSVARSRTLLS